MSRSFIDWKSIELRFLLMNRFGKNAENTVVMDC